MADMEIEVGSLPVLDTEPQESDDFIVDRGGDTRRTKLMSFLNNRDGSYDLLEAVANGDDQIVARLAGGTGDHGRYSLDTLRNYFVGALSNLKTQDKTEIVKAVNEINDNVKAVKELVDFFNDGYGVFVPQIKLIGEKLGTEHKAAIANGTFKGLHVGNYMEQENDRVYLTHPDYFYNKGDTKCLMHHFMSASAHNIIKSDGSTTHIWNDTNTTEGGYTNCKYRKTYKSQCDTFYGKFGTVVKHRELLSNATKDGVVSGLAWVDCTSELPSEPQMYGTIVWGNSSIGGSGYNIGINYIQEALFALCPGLIRNDENYYCRDVVSASAVANVDANGVANYSAASVVWVGALPHSPIS